MSSIGTEFKMNVHMEPVGSIHLSDVDFECTFYVYTNRKVLVKKEEMVMVDEDNYIAVIDSQKIGVGRMSMTMKVWIPDADCKDGLRTDIVSVQTDAVIKP